MIAMPHDITIISPAGKVVLPKEHFVPETGKNGKVLAWIYRPKEFVPTVPQYERGDLP